VPRRRVVAILVVRLWILEGEYEIEAVNGKKIKLSYSGHDSIYTSAMRLVGRDRSSDVLMKGMFVPESV
jgi:hypothetical protein